MKFSTPHTLKSIAALFDLSFEGNPDLPVLGCNEIHVVEQGDIVFCDNAKYYEKAFKSNASVVLVKERTSFPEGKGILIANDPLVTFNAINEYFVAPQKASDFKSRVHESSQISANACIGENVSIGKNCIIHPGVVIYNNCTIGDNVTIHANTVIGADGFYFQKRPEIGYLPLYNSGNVVIEDDVIIGALVTIDKGVTASTTIKKGCRIDNQVHIGHDTVVGEYTLIAGQNAIAGCVLIGNHVKIWGSSAISSGLIIEDNAEILAFSGVDKNVKTGSRVWGAPARDAREKLKEIATLRRLAK